MAETTIGMPSQGKHYLFLGGVLWGHVRPAQGFILNLLRLHPTLRVTFIMSGIVGNKAVKDKKRYDPTPDMEARLRTIHTVEGPKEGAALTTKMEYLKVITDLNVHLEETLTKVLKREAIKDTMTGEDVHAFPDPPLLVFNDITMLSGIQVVEKVYKELNVKPPKFCAFMPLGTVGVRNLKSDPIKAMIKEVCASENQEEAYEKASTASRRGFTKLKMAIVDQIIVNRGTIVEGVNHHPFYAHEMDPNESTLFFFPRWNHLYSVIESSPWDYLINTWPACLDRDHAKYLQGLVKEEQFSLGPQLPLDHISGDTGEFSVEGEQGEVQTFLDKQFKQSGPRSVLFISFGSLEYPPTEEQLRILLGTLDELRVPYILARGSPPEPIAAILPSLLQASEGRGLLCTWVKQVAVLRHPAILGFLTHGGSSSAMEALLCGVPMIQWPCMWDQPGVANELDYRGVAHELIQFRLGHNIGKATARGPTVIGTPEAMRAELREVVNKLRGPQGEEMRIKAKKLGEQIEKDAAPGGLSHEMMLKIGKLCD